MANKHESGIFKMGVICFSMKTSLKKLTLYGCNGLSLGWFRSYLNSSQICEVARTVSSTQGPNLGHYSLIYLCK